MIPLIDALLTILHEALPAPLKESAHACWKTRPKTRPAAAS